MKCRHNKKGSVLFYLIVTMTALTVLGTGVFYMTTTSSFSGLGVSAQNKARYLAEAGIRYALANLRTLPNTTAEYKLNNAAGDKFILEVKDLRIGDLATIKSSGVVNPGTPFQASHKISIDIKREQYEPLTRAPFSFAGTGGGGMAALAAPALGGGTSGASGVSVDTVNQQINLGFNPSTGAGIPNTAGCVWYQGWADSNGSDCVAGRCNFNKGIRAYFDIEYTDWVADGFTFAIISAQNNGTEELPVYINDVTDCGGGSCGEYMGYAGPGSKTSGHGLQPPKIAVEFDPYISCPSCYNSATCSLPPCLSGTCSNICNTPCQCTNQCLDNCTICDCSTRYDRSFASSTEPERHVSLMYWGTNTTNPCGATTEGKYTFDDNIHGRGDGTTNPKNPLGTDTADNKGFMRINFADSMYAGKLSFRVEIDRLSDGTYKIYGWVKAYSASGYTDSDGVKFNDTSQRYNKSNNASHLPNFKQQAQFSTGSTGWHNKFDRMIFGWTQGTGGSTQKVILKNFKIDFKNKNDF